MGSIPLILQWSDSNTPKKIFLDDAHRSPPNAISMLNIQRTIYAKRNTILQKGKGGGGGGGEGNEK